MRGSEPVSIFGFQFDVGLEPIPVSADRMVKAFQLGLSEFLPLWEDVVSKEVLARLKSMIPMDKELKFPDDLWVRTLYDFALAAHRKVMTHDHLLKSFTPLYLGRVASFILETQQSSHREVEEKIEGLCKLFEHEKHYLIERWEDQKDEVGGKS